MKSTEARFDAERDEAHFALIAGSLVIDPRAALTTSSELCSLLWQMDSNTSKSDIIWNTSWFVIFLVTAALQEIHCTTCTTSGCEVAHESEKDMLSKLKLVDWFFHVDRRVQYVRIHQAGVKEKVE